jgi:hypothetical protein
MLTQTERSFRHSESPPPLSSRYCNLYECCHSYEWYSLEGGLGCRGSGGALSLFAPGNAGCWRFRCWCCSMLSANSCPEVGAMPPPDGGTTGGAPGAAIAAWGPVDALYSIPSSRASLSSCACWRLNATCSITYACWCTSKDGTSRKKLFAI